MGYEAFNIGLKSPVALPLVHVHAILEVLCEVIDSGVPGGEIGFAKATSGDYARREVSPVLHGWVVVNIMGQAQMLSKVIFS